MRSRKEDVVVVIADDFAKEFARRSRRRSSWSPTARARIARRRCSACAGCCRRYSAQIGSLRLIARGVSPVVANAVADRGRRGLERAAAGGADPRLHPDVHDDRRVHRRHADRHRLDGRRTRARIARGAAGQSRAARRDRRRQVAGEHDHRDVQRIGDRRAALRDVQVRAVAGPRHPIPHRDPTRSSASS